MSAEVIKILLVEDNPGDVRLTKEAFGELKMANELYVANDGEEALTFLRNQDKPRPDLIMLDLNLPKMDGRQVLAELKKDPDLKRIPVVVLTSSTAEEDVIKTYDLHANCYVTKPLDFQQFNRIVQEIEHFWFGIVKLPNK